MKNLIPRFIHDNYLAGTLTGQLEAATLFVDISGFTPMTEALMAFGDEGAEILSGILNRVFQPMVDAVYNRGGFITLFAGDAFTAIFPQPVAQISNLCKLGEQKALIANLCYNALTCARRIQTIFKQQGLQKTKAGDFALAVKVGASFGRVEWGIVGQSIAGGLNPRQLIGDGAAFYFRGAAIDGCAHAEHHAEKGQIIFDDTLGVQSDSFGALSAKAKLTLCTPVADGFYHLLSIPKTARNDISPRNVISKSRLRSAIVRRFLPDAVADFKGHGEFRNVVSIFISFEGVANHDELNRFASILIQNQSRFGGYLKEFDFGDKGGVAIVFFGAPVAFEKNMERALDFISAVRRDFPNLKDLENLKWRAGITYGLTFAGIIGGRQRCQYSPMGATVNLAVRLMMKAAWGDIYVTERVRHDAGHAYEINYIDAIKYKGIADPVATYTLLAAKAQVASLYHGQFVGREAEVEQLLAWAQPIFGEDPKSFQKPLGSKFAGIVYIYGAPGGGKSRLVHEATEQLRHRCAILRLHTDSILQKSFNPIIYFLKDYFDQEPQLSPAENKARFEKKYGQLITSLNPIDIASAERLELQRTRSTIGALLEHQWDNSLYARLDPKDRYENTISALKTLFQALSRLQPIIILLEDLQWLDPDTPKLFTRLTRAINSLFEGGQEDDNASPAPDKSLLQRGKRFGYPILILVTSRYRDDGSKPALPMDKDVTCHTIELGGLPDDSLATVMADQLHAEIAPETVRFIADKSGHNPFFAGQYAHYLKEQGLLLLDNGVYHLPPTLAEIGLPATLTDLLMARLDRLQPRLKELIKTAAVIGREFESVFLMTVIHQLDPAFPMAQFYPDLEMAAQDQIWSAVQEIRYAFTHVLLRDAAYGMQLKARLRQLHGLIAETIEQLNPDDPAYYADIALHYEKAERLEPAKAFYDKAGQAAQDKYALLLADQYVTAALKLCLQLHGEKHTETANAYAKAGKICELQAKYDRALDAYQKALAIRQELLGEKHPDTAGSYHNIGMVYRNKGESDRSLDYHQKALAIQLELLGEKHPDTAKSYHNIGTVYYNKGDYDRALSYYQKASAIRLELLGEKHPDTAASYNNIGNVYSNKREYDRALDYYQKALAIKLELLGEKHPDTALSYNNIGNVYSNKREYDRALDYYQKALAIQLELLGEKHPDTASSYLGIGNVLYVNKGEDDRALEYYQKSLVIRRELLGEKHLSTATLYNNIGMVYWDKSEYGRALEYLHKALAIQIETGAKGDIGNSLSSLAHVYFWLKDDEKALATALRYLQHIREIGTDVGHGKTHLAIALVLARPNRFPKPVRAFLDEITALTGLPETPAAYFEKAIETAGAKNYLPTLVPALYEYGRYLYQTGQPQAGLSHLRQAKEKAVAGGMQGEVRKIEKIFEELGIKN